MVEGHQCHRVAAAHRKLLVGRAFKATSPNARFDAGAAAISGKLLAKIEVHGKNIFYFFRRRNSAAAPPAAAPAAQAQKAAQAAAGASAAPAQALEHDIVHVHFGMAGAFKTFRRPGEAPTATTRLRLESDELDLVAHLSAMVVNYGDDSYYADKLKALGPDPLREDADAELLWRAVQGSKKPIGLVLMDQSMIAGLGNIYRAEVLFKARVHPEQPANTITREEFDSLWRHSTHALQRGFVTGSILTVDAADAAALGPPWTRRYVYNHKRCGVCRGAVKSWDMANRTVYACTACQALRKGTEIPEARRKALAAAGESREFVSHCATDAGATLTPAKMTVAQLTAKLQEAGMKQLPKNKPALVALLTTHLQGLHDAPEDTLAADAAAAAPDTVPQAPAAVTNKTVDQEPEESSGAAQPEGVDAGHGKRRARRTPVTAVAKVAAATAATGDGSVDTAKMKVPELKAQLRQLGVRYPAGAKKAELVELATWAGTMATGAGPPAPAVSAPAGDAGDDATVSPELYEWDAAGPSSSGAPAAPAASGAAAAQESAASHAARCAAGEYGPNEPVVPGIRQFEAVATAREAALEKEAAGENRAVEHVALAENADGLIGLGRLASDAEDDYADVPSSGDNNGAAAAQGKAAGGKGRGNKAAAAKRQRATSGSGTKRRKAAAQSVLDKTAQVDADAATGTGAAAAGSARHQRGKRTDGTAARAAAASEALKPARSTKRQRSEMQAADVAVRGDATARLQTGRAIKGAARKPAGDAQAFGLAGSRRSAATADKFSGASGFKSRKPRVAHV